jgi:3-keto-disaccharide hydrolase
MSRLLIDRCSLLPCAVLFLAFPWTLTAALAGDGLPGAGASQTKAVELFNGRDLSGWDPVGKGAIADWSVENGCLVCKGIGHTWLRTARQYADFHLWLEYQVSPGANSGVYVRVGADGNHHRENTSAPPAGFEVQILDDRSSRYSQLKDYQFSASLYDIAGAAPRVSKAAGQWNSLEIECVGEHVTIRHNGKRVVDATPERYPLLTLRQKRGYLGLQSHNGVVLFRNLRISPPDSRS